MLKNFVFVLLLLSLNATSAFAEDVSDLELGGLSIGDNLLDYTTKNIILEQALASFNDYSFLNEPDKYIEVYLPGDFANYDNLTATVKNVGTNAYIRKKNEEYIIGSLRGIVYYIDDITRCLTEKNDIVKELSLMFPKSEKRNSDWKSDIHPEQIKDIYATNFTLGSDDTIEVSCYDYDPMNNDLPDQLNISIDTKEFRDWLTDY